MPEIGPEQRGHHDADDDEDATHGRRARFFLVGLWAILADVLADLKFAQLADQPGSQKDTEEERRQAGKQSARGDVAEYAEGTNRGIELFVQKPVEHRLSLDPFVESA